MNGLLRAVIVVALGGAVSFIFGQLLPRRWFRPEVFPYKDWKWELGGHIYLKLGINRWKDRMPDMSRIIPGMVKKKAGLARVPESMYRLIQETCVAEFIHWLLVFLVSPLVYAEIGGIWGVAAAIVNIMGNMVFILIQRYNRPRLVEIYKRMEKRREKCS